MSRKLLCVILSLVLCLCTAAPAFAAGTTYVVDEIGYLTQDEAGKLNQIAGGIHNRCGVAIFFVYTTEPTLQEYDVAALVGGLSDYFVMVENDTSWYTFAGGLAAEKEDEMADVLRNAYDEPTTYLEGVQAYLLAGEAFFGISADTPAVEAPVVDTPSAGEYFLFDEANLLTDSEEAALTEALTEVSRENEAQIVIATISSLDGSDIDSYLNYLYDSMGFGYGANHDGVLLLVCMNPREYRILSNGYAGVAIDTDAIDVIGEKMVPDLSGGNYAAAFRTFTKQCSYYLDGHTNGFPFRFGKNLAICLVIGALVGLIVALILKGQLKSVRKQNRANVYVKPNSMQVTVRNDLFLYRDVRKTKKESSSSSGGSRSGNGSARSTGGGSF